MAELVRDVMHEGCECIGENDTALDAAKRLAELKVGSMPICGEDDMLKGMVTDRDIVVKVVAEGKEPGQTKISELAEGKPVVVGAQEPIEKAISKMEQHDIRRLPVIDEDKNLVGMLAQADIARQAGRDKTGELVGDVSEAPAQL